MRLLLTLFIFLTPNLFAQSLPLAQKYPDPPNACYEGCTPWQAELLADFETKGQLLDLEPAVYSGDCHHLGGAYSPDPTHYSVVLIDQRKNSEDSTIEPRFATFFSFFAQANEYIDWSLEKARDEMTAPWKPWGHLIVGERTSRVEVPYEDGTIANHYWIRQNPETKTLYYITYFGGSYQKAFCRLEKNRN